MAKWVEEIGRTVGVIIDAFTAMDNWTPSHAGRLKRVGVLPGGIAATTLIENGEIKLSCSGFGGVDMIAPFDGGGVATAPRASRDVQWTDCDLAVTQTPIKVFYYHNVIPTTPEITIFAEIEG